jgi:hypothetical protein
MEAEVKRMLALGHWPHSCSEDLRAHVAACGACGDFVTLTQAFRAAHVQSVAAASPPPAGVLWWRAQLRRRDAARQRIQRPLVGAQLFALAVTLLFLAATLMWETMRGLSWTAEIAVWFASAKQSSAFHLDALWPFAGGQSNATLMYLVPGAAMLLLLGGLAVYLATEKQ